MNHLIIRELLDGNNKIVDYFITAGDKWSEVIGTSDIDDVSALADWCSDNQLWFEQNCGGRWLGQEVMVTAGIAGFYDPSGGFDDESCRNALNVYHALKESRCSVEVKYHAEDIAKSYSLIDR